MLWYLIVLTHENLSMYTLKEKDKEKCLASMLYYLFHYLSQCICFQHQSNLNGKLVI